MSSAATRLLDLQKKAISGQYSSTWVEAIITLLAVSKLNKVLHEHAPLSGARVLGHLSHLKFCLQFSSPLIASFQLHEGEKSSTGILQYLGRLTRPTSDLSPDHGLLRPSGRAIVAADFLNSVSQSALYS